MEAEDVFADELNVGGPEIRDVGVWVAEDGEVVGKGVNPDIHDLVGVARDGDAPREVLFGARDGDVGRGLEEVEDLFFAGSGEDLQFVGFNGGLDAGFEIGDF